MVSSVEPFERGRPPMPFDKLGACPVLDTGVSGRIKHRSW